MRSTFGNSLPLQTWSDTLELNPWLVAQIEYSQYNTSENRRVYNEDLRPAKDCDDVFYDKIHYNGKPSRTAINRAINMAEIEFTGVLGYNPAPKFEKIKVKFPKTKRNGRSNIDYRSIYSNGLSIPNFKTINTQRGKIWDFGTRVETSLGEFAVTGIEQFDDSLQEAFQLTVAGIDSSVEKWQVQVFYPSDTLPFTDKEKSDWEIKPIYIEWFDDNSTTKSARITFFKYNAIRPELLLTAFPKPLIAANDIYVSEVEVVIQSVDSSSANAQGSYYWNDTSCTIKTASACFQVNDPDRGRISLSYDSDNNNVDLATACSRNNAEPDIVEINILSGCYWNSDGNMDNTCSQIVSYLSASRLSCEPCGCGCGDGKTPLSYWSEMLTHEKSGVVFLGSTPKEREESEFGQTNGDLMAWRLAKHLRKKEFGVSVF